MQKSVLVLYPMCSVQSSRRSSISDVELWGYRPFSVELPGFRFGEFPARSSRAFVQNPSKLQGNVYIKVQLPLLEVQRGPPHDLTKTVEFEQDLSLILEGFGTALKNSFLVPTHCFQSRALAKIAFHGLSFGRIVGLVLSSRSL